MLRMLIKIVANISWPAVILSLGGIWKTKELLTRLGDGHFKTFLLTCFDLALAKKGSWIGYQSSFANRPLFPHDMYGIFVSAGARVGRNCVIFQQVTIGSNTLIDSKGKGYPIIGNDCYIGAGAKIIGDIRIGDNCRIGSNAVVYTDMPDNSVAVSQPTNIIQKGHLVNRYYSKKADGWYYYENERWIRDDDFKVPREP